MMRLFGLQMPVRMSRKTERAFRQLERLSDELGQGERDGTPNQEDHHAQYVEGRVGRRTLLGPGAFQKAADVETSEAGHDAEALRRASLSSEEQVRELFLLILGNPDFG